MEDQRVQVMNEFVFATKEAADVTERDVTLSEPVGGREDASDRSLEMTRIMACGPSRLPFPPYRHYEQESEEVADTLNESIQTAVSAETDAIATANSQADESKERQKV